MAFNRSNRLLFIVVFFALVFFTLQPAFARGVNNSPVFEPTLTVIAWNVKFGDSNPTVVTLRIKDVNGCDIWGFAEIDRSTMLVLFESAAEECFFYFSSAKLMTNKEDSLYYVGLCEG